MKTGVEIIAEERKRQIDVEGWTLEHDSTYFREELAQAAACYAIPEKNRDLTCSFSGTYYPILWPNGWQIKFWKPSPANRIKELAKAGALIAAEIDRLQRIKTK